MENQEGSMQYNDDLYPDKTREEALNKLFVEKDGDYFEVVEAIEDLRLRKEVADLWLDQDVRSLKLKRIFLEEINKDGLPLAVLIEKLEKEREAIKQQRLDVYSNQIRDLAKKDHQVKQVKEYIDILEKVKTALKKYEYDTVPVSKEALGKKVHLN